jgi:hypothetical protein
MQKHSKLLERIIVASVTLLALLMSVTYGGILLDENGRANSNEFLVNDVIVDFNFNKEISVTSII